MFNLTSRQDELCREAATRYTAARERLVRAYENDSDKRRDLLQEIHLALWLSFESYEARCSIRTWVYRVAHNPAASYVIRQRRVNMKMLVNLDRGAQGILACGAPVIGSLMNVSRLQRAVPV